MGHQKVTLPRSLLFFSPTLFTGSAPTAPRDRSKLFYYTFNHLADSDLNHAIITNDWETKISAVQHSAPEKVDHTCKRLSSGCQEALHALAQKSDLRSNL